MKQLIKIILLSLLPIFSYAQETTIEIIDIISRPIDTIFYAGDTITTAYFNVEKRTTTNVTSFPDIRIDTVLIQSNGYPVDSLEVLRRIHRDVTEMQNRAAHIMNRAFEEVRRKNVDYMQLRTLYNSFTGSELYLRNEDAWFSSFEGIYRIFDLEAGTNVLADLVRVGAGQRYRLVIRDGQPGAGNSYSVIPTTNGNSFILVNYPTAALPAATYRLYWDRGVDITRPVYRHAGYLDGRDIIRIVKVR